MISKPSKLEAILIAFVLWSGFGFSANAQECDCPGQNIIDAFKTMIADRKAKLEFLADGKFETASGFSNIPEMLQQEISELERIIEKRARRIVQCRKQCFNKGMTELSDPDTGISLPIAKNDCPKCYGAYLRYIYDEDFGISPKGLDGLIRCNLLHCRPQNATSTFQDGNIPDISPLEPAPSTADNSGADANNPSSTTASKPQDQNAVSGPGMITIPNFPSSISNTPAKAFPAELHRQLTGTCAYEPENVCDKLGPDVAAECRSLVSSWTSECKAVFPRTKLPSIALCQQECEVFASEARTSLRLRDLVLQVIKTNAETLVTKERKELQEEAQGLETKLAVLGEKIAKTRVQLYQNENSGEIIEHFGEFFEPKPPLIHVGDRPALPSKAQKDQIKTLTEMLESGRLKLETHSDEADKSNWQNTARLTWLGSGPENSPIGCTADEVAPHLAECRAFCASQGERTDIFVGPHVQEICQPIAIMGLLYLPISRSWIYPQGNPWRNPGYGR